MQLIVYRISPFKQHNPSPVYPDDKYKLVKFSHESFLKAKTGKEKTVYLLDRCEEWADLFSPYGEIINYNAGSRGGSLDSMYETARAFEGNILFVEDDYLWRPNTLQHIWRSIAELKLISPYDHPSHYQMNPSYNLKVVNNIVYRDAPSNTHTFAVEREFFLENYDTFFGFKDADGPMFEALPKKVWVPVGNSFATHLVENLLAPSVDWNLPDL